MKKEQILETVQNSNLNITEIAKLYSISREDLIKVLIDLEFFELKDNPNARFPTVKRLREASVYYKEIGGSSTMTVTDLSEKFGTRKTKLRDYINKWYPEVPTEVLKTYDEHVFDSIDTEEKAYWLGFIYADGYISSDPLNGISRYHFELQLSIKDKDHLKKFADFIGYKKELKDKNTHCNTGEYNSSRLIISNKHLWETLNNYGCTPRKSLTLEFPDESIFKDKSLIRHFIRGYFDGDGTLGIYTCNVKEYIYGKAMCSVLGTENVLSRICSFLQFPKNISNAGSKLHPCKAFKLSYATKEAFAVSYILYSKSTVYMKRKYEKYLEFCRLYKELYKELEDKIGEDCDVNTEIISKITKGLEIS